MAAHPEYLPQPSVDYDGAPVCERCNERIRPDDLGVMCLVMGWVENRTGGGAHAVSERRDLGRYRHTTCHKYRPPSLF
jgi:hypothetical protein